MDAVINSNDPGKNSFMERVNERNGMRIFDSAMKYKNFGYNEDQTSFFLILRIVYLLQTKLIALFTD